jgi:RTX calcium-binding nonapeptide repeat (4 copies)
MARGRGCRGRRRALALAPVAPADVGATVTVTDTPERTLTFTDGDAAHQVEADSFLGILRIRFLMPDPMTTIDSSGAQGACLNFGFEINCSGFAGRVVIDLGGGDDHFSVTEGAVDPFLNELVVKGGPGNDSIATGRADDVLDGGAGDDVLDGGEGFDVADYGARSAPVTVALPDPRGTTIGNGADGENDSLHSIEGAIGGDGNDRLTGGTGDDELAGAGGVDSLSAGAGDDFIDSSDDPKLADGQIDCGEGHDAVFADNLVDVPAPDCEVLAPELYGNPTFNGRPIEGEKLTANIPGYSGTAASDTTQWLSCDDTGADCIVVSNGSPSYLMTQDDVGSTIRVLVHAENEAGFDERVSSPSAVVASRSPTPAPAPPARVQPALPSTAAPRRLMLAIASARCAARRCAIRLRVGGDVARIKAELRKGKRRLAVATKPAKPGALALTIRLSKPLRRGAYALRLTVIANDGRKRWLDRTVHVR